MSRDCDVNLIANQIVQATGENKSAGDGVQSQFERLTMGLAEYERQQVARAVNFRLAAAVL